MTASAERQHGGCAAEIASASRHKRGSRHYGFQLRIVKRNHFRDRSLFQGWSGSSGYPKTSQPLRSQSSPSCSARVFWLWQLSQSDASCASSGYGSPPRLIGVRWPRLPVRCGQAAGRPRRADILAISYGGAAAISASCTAISPSRYAIIA